MRHLFSIPSCAYEKGEGLLRVCMIADLSPVAAQGVEHRIRRVVQFLRNLQDRLPLGLRETPGSRLSAYDTAAADTPARAAISFRLTLLSSIGSVLSFHHPPWLRPLAASNLFRLTVKANKPVAQQ